MEVKYYVLPNTITVVKDGSIYNISSSNERYNEALNAIESKDLNSLVLIVDPVAKLNNPDFKVDGGLVRYKNELLPSVLGDQFLKYKAGSVSFIGLVNFWVNLKHRFDFGTAKENVIKMLNQNAYPLTDDGFLMVYRGGDASWYEKADNSDKSIPFYSYGSCYESVRKDFENRLSLEDICIKYFGYYSKKLRKVVQKEMFGPYLKINDDVFKYASLFSGILAQENLIKFIEDKVFYQSITRHYSSKENFDKIKEFLSKLTDKKILNLLTNFSQEKKHEIENGFLQAIEGYHLLKDNNINVDINDHSSLLSFYEQVKKELHSLKSPLIKLNTLQGFPYLKDIDLKITKEWTLVIPESNHDLTSWSNQMNNCIHSFAQKVKNRETLVLAVKDKTGEMIFNISVINYRIDQFVKNHNRQVIQEDKDIVINYLKENGVLK